MKRAILDRQFMPSILTSDYSTHQERIFSEKEITAATAVTIPVDLNGMSELEFFIAETAGVNNIATFNISAKFYESSGVEITSSEETVVVPQTTAGQNQYVAITGTEYIQKATKAEISFTLPHSADYTVHCYVKGISSSSDSSPQEVIQSDATKLKNTEANSAAILAAILAGGGTSVLAPLVNFLTPFDGSAAYTSNVTITLSGFPFTVADANSIVAFVGVKASGEDDYTFYNAGVDSVGFSVTADVLTIAGAGTPFAAGDSYLVGIISQEKGWDATNEALQVERIDGDDQKFIYTKKTWSSETKAEHIDLDGYGDVSVDIDIASGSLTLQLSNNNEDAATAIATWHDVTGFVGVTSDTHASSSAMDNAKWLKIVSTAAATATIYAKQKQ
jgi:hypothetical protein